MQTYFLDLIEHLESQTHPREVFMASYAGEDSDFVRFNQGQVRHAMHVRQQYLTMRLVDGRRQIASEITLSGDRPVDVARIDATVASLRERLSYLPEDPYLLYSHEPASSARIGANQLPPAHLAVNEVLQSARGLDLVGLYASGGTYHGFANSFGQRNWFEAYSHNMEWSLYHATDKAVKSMYAGVTWDSHAFEEKMAGAKEQLGHLKTPARTIDPGTYRIYLSPSALQEVIEMLTWGGFGMKDHRTKQTPLLRMVEEDATLAPLVSLRENTRDGVAADFQDDGFIKPPIVSLIEGGRYQSCLISPRSAQEFGVPTNGAAEGETPTSLDMDGGTLPDDRILSELGTGLYVNNLHYLNFSDRSACRITGMTRFATFWVDKGRIAAPVNVMRFDETVYRVLGENLLGLTAGREFLLNPLTYGSRSTGSTRLPGALIEDFTFTL